MTNILRNKNNKNGGVVKKIFFSLFGVFLMVGGVVLTACGNDQKASISVSSDYFVENENGNYLLNVSLNEGDSNSVTVFGKVQNASDGRIKISNSYENIVYATTNYNPSRDESTITISGVSEGIASLFLDSYTGGADQVKLDVFVYSDITGLKQAEDLTDKKTQFVEKNVELELDSDKFLSFKSRQGGESNRKDVEWTFKTDESALEQTYDDGKLLLSNQNELVASIENNKLNVNDDYPFENIVLTASSLFTDFKADVELVVLEEFDKTDITATYGRTSDNVLGAITDISTNGSIPVVRNDKSVENSKFYVQLAIDCAYEYAVKPVISFDKEGNSKTNDYLVVTADNSENLFKVDGKNSDLPPRKVYLSFVVELNGYEKSVKTDSIKVSLSDNVSKMIIYSADEQVFDGAEIELYNNYLGKTEKERKGQCFVVQLKPDTVLKGLDTYKIQVEIGNGFGAVEEIDDLISAWYEDEEISFVRNAETGTFTAYIHGEEGVFDDNSEIFLKAMEDLCNVGKSFKITFISTQTQSVKTSYTLKGVKAPDSDFTITEGSETSKFFATNEPRTIYYNVGVDGIDSVEGLYLDYNTELPIETSSLSYNKSSKILSFSVSSTEAGFKGDVGFTIRHKNGAKCEQTLTLKAFVPLDSAKVVLDNTGSFGVSSYTYDENGSLESVVMTLGSVAKLNYVVNGGLDEVEIDGEDFLSSEGLLTARSVTESTGISISFIGKDEDGNSLTIPLSFNLEVYVPVASLTPVEQLPANLIARDSLSSEDENLAVQKITIWLRNDTNQVTYKDLDLFKLSSSTIGGEGKNLSEAQNGEIKFEAENLEYDVKNISINGNILAFDIVAKSTNGYSSFSDTLNLSYNKFGSNIRSAITLNVTNATRVQKVIWENEQDSIYLNPNSSDIKEKSFIIVSNIYPQNVYNKDLTYVFVPDTGYSPNLVRVENGVVQTSGMDGGTGYIYVLPTDSIKLNGGQKSIYFLDKTNDYEPQVVLLSNLASEYNRIVRDGYLLSGPASEESSYVSYAETFKKIRVIVADGITEATAIRIYNKDQFKEINLSRHYELMADLTLEASDCFDGVLTGSIRGYVLESDKDLDVKGSRSFVQITLVGGASSTFVNKISESGKVRDLTFVGSSVAGFVTAENDGIISNITIGVNTSGPTISSSYVSGSNVGAITSTNNGQIDRCEVLGATISAVNNAGGIAGINTGVISKSFVELYKFSEEINSTISGAATAGGLVGYSNGGEITECYVYDYTLTKDSTEFNIKDSVESGEAKIGALVGACDPTDPGQNAQVGTLASRISNSFAVVGIKEFIGDGEAQITDCYLSYYQGTATEEDDESPFEHQFSEDLHYETMVTKTRTSDYWTSGEGIVAYVNGGFRHLKFYQELMQSPVAIIQTILGKSLAVGDGNGILMIHKLQVSSLSLSISEQNALSRQNKIAIKDLFEEGHNNIIVRSENPSVVSTTADSIIINTKGNAELKLYSNKDFSTSQTLNVKVINTISNFDSDIDYNLLSVQEGHAKAITYSTKDKVYLGSESYDLERDEYALVGSIKDSLGNQYEGEDISYAINGMVGTIAVNSVSNQGPDKYTLSVNMTVDELGAFDVDNPDENIYNKAIFEAFNNDTALTAFKGATYIGLSNESLLIYPSMVTNLYVDLVTDEASDQINIEVKNKGNVYLVKASISADQTIFKDAGKDKILIKTTTNSYDAENKTRKFILTISIVSKYRSEIFDDETYVVYVSSKSGTASNENASAEITLKRQDINHIDMTNYLYDTSSNIAGKIIYTRKNQISSTITPGKSSIMVVGVDPTYAHYEYFKVEATNEGKWLNITKLLNYENSYVTYEFDDESIVSYEGHSIKVVPKDHEEQYAFKVFAPSSIKESLIIPFKITFYDRNGNILTTKQYDIAISYQKPPELIVNENRSSIIAKGGTASIKVSIDKNQKLRSLSLQSVEDGISINNFAGPFDDEDGSIYYTATLFASVKAKVTAGGNGNFQIKAEVERVINGVVEIADTRYEMTLVAVGLESTESDVISELGQLQEFNLNYKFTPETYVETNSDALVEIEKLETIRSGFEKNGWYVDNSTDFAINPKKNGNNAAQDTGTQITERLFVVNGTLEAKVNFVDGVANLGSFELIYEQKENSSDYVLKIRGKSTTASSIRLRLDNYIFTNKNSSSYNTISYYYNVSVVNYTDEDRPDVIYSAEEFLAIQNNELPQNYILMSDIELEDYVPFDTSMIASLDGNGYSINITSFDINGTGTLERALFRNVTSNTTLKNIRVNYYLGGEMNVDVSTSSGYSTIRVAGFAISNSGIVTNCHVMSYPYTSASKAKKISAQGLIVNLQRLGEDFTLNSSSDITSEIAGFVINNQGTITNSTVGGKEYVQILETETTSAIATSYDLAKFTITGQGNIAGFAISNSGVIASSCVDQIEIINDATNINLKTAGFVISNAKRISTSFVAGIYEEGTGKSEYTKCLSGSKISSRGYVSGFVDTNSGDINDCNTNILLEGPGSETNSYFTTGFVYVNTGKVTTSYSGCKLSSGNISQTGFSGVDVKNTSLNTGKIELCYYNGSNVQGGDNDDNESVIKTGAILAKNPSSETQFYGFTFASDISANDGIWCIYNDILTLVAPNQKAVSRRVRQDTEDSYILPYASITLDNDSVNKNEYKYGGKHNPIIIRDAEEFRSAMGGADASTNVGKFCQNGVISGSYRLLADIRLSDLNSSEGVAVIDSTQDSFTGILDGNGFEINNISLGGSSTNYSVGLFSQIYKAVVVNLDLEFLSVTATTSGFVGGLAGIVYDSSLINITAEQAVPGDGASIREFGIQGYNSVGGIAGAVFGNSKIVNVSMSNPIVQATSFNDSHEIDNNFYTGASSGSSTTKEKPDQIRQAFEGLKNDSIKMISSVGLKTLCKEEKYFANSSYAGGLFGYVDTYTSTQKNERIYSGREVSDKEYRLFRLRVTDTVNVRAEISGGQIGYVGINTNIRDAGIILSKTNVSSNILSYNGVAGGLIGMSAGTLNQVFAEHDESYQIQIEEKVSSYYQGSSGVDRGIEDIFVNSVLTNENITYSPKFIGGLIGYMRTGRLVSAYSKLNVISNSVGTIVGGIVGEVGLHETGEVFNVKGRVNSFSTSALLNEVYAFGDVLGGENNDGKFVSGGIVGKIQDNAKLSLSAVNSVNYFGSFNDAVYNAAPSEKGIYAIAGKVSASATINSILPVIAIESAESHIGYVSTIQTCLGNSVLLPYEGYTKPGMGEPVDGYFEMNSLEDLQTGSAAYVEMNASFLGSGTWSQENWTHDIERAFPELRLITTEDFIYWDNTNKLDVLKELVNGTSKEIRVRGLDGFGEIQPLDLSTTEYASLLPIDGVFAGRLIGGWDASGDRDLEQVKNQSIKINGKSFFKTLGANAIIDSVQFEFSGNINVEGGLLVQSEVANATFTNLTIDVGETSGISISAQNYNSNAVGYAGLIAPRAINTNFRGITLNTYAANSNKTIEFSGDATTLYTGLLAGEILQASNMSTLSIKNIEIDYYGDSNQIQKTTYGTSTNSVYSGMIAGKASIAEDASALTISGVTIKDNNPTKKPATILVIQNVDKDLQNLYLGGYFGEIDGAYNVDFTPNGDATTYIKVKAPKFTSSGFVGGFVGKLNSNTTSFENKDTDLKTEITYSDGRDANIGGLFGAIKTGSLTLQSKTLSLIVGGETNDDNLTINNTLNGELTNSGTNKTNIGGILGKTDSDQALSISVTTNSGDAEDIKSIIYAKSESGLALNVGGLFGDETSDELLLKVSQFTSNINISGTAFTSLNAGALSGQKQNGGENYKIANASGTENAPLSARSTIICTSTAGSANIGGLIGKNSGAINLTRVNLNFILGSQENPIEETKQSIKTSYTTNPFNVTGQANVGGYIGNSSEAITVSGGTITEGSKIAVSAGNATNVGGLVGLTSGAFTLSGNKFENHGLFAVTNSTNSETNVGGLVGEIQTSGSVQIGKNTEEDDYSYKTSAFIDANFFVNAANTNLGGMIGKISSMASGSRINETIFGGAFKSYDSFGTHVFGGIVGKTESGVSGSLNNNSSFGDDIVTYSTDTNRFSSYTFGGIIGDNQGLSLNGNYSLTTCNNDRLTTTDKRGAIVGNHGSGSYGSADATRNLYSHVVNLCTDGNGKDVGYMTAYNVKRGYNRSGDSSADTDALVSKLLNRTLALNKGSKLNPIKILADGSEDNEEITAENPKSDTNGISYFYFESDTTILNQVTASADGKRAIIGNARVLKFGTADEPKGNAFISGTLSQNEIISGMNLDIQISDDTGATHGGLVSEMTGGTIYAVALSGKLSVGGTDRINLGAFTTISGGLIDECNTSVDVIYRADGRMGTADNDGSGDVAGFVAAKQNNGGLTFIRNSYSTGQVSSYISANLFAFNDEGTDESTNFIISNCYTISQINRNDYTTSDDASGIMKNFGTTNTTLTDCWYDINATECRQSGLTEKTTSNVAIGYNSSSTDSKWDGSNEVSGWTRSKAYNFGYATRNFGYLKQSSYAQAGTTYQEDRITAADSSYTGITKTTYTRSAWNVTSGVYIVPNAGKLNQLNSSGNYVQWYDFDLDAAGLNAIIIPRFNGIYDGQELTIKGNTEALFNYLTGNVKNLRLTDVKLTKLYLVEENENNFYAAGSLANYAVGGELNNIITTGENDFAVDQDHHNNKTIGGMVGCFENGKIYNCKNYAKVNCFENNNKVYGTAFVGGCSGYFFGEIQNSLNYGPIQCDLECNSYAGGIIGGTYDTYIKDWWNKRGEYSTKIENCGNVNSVFAGYLSKDPGSSVNYYAGGIVGRSDTGTHYGEEELIVNNCYNTAMIKAGNKNLAKSCQANAGGIVGHTYIMTSSGLYNSGVVEALGKNGEWKVKSANQSLNGKSYSLDVYTDDRVVNVYADGIGSVGWKYYLSSYNNEGYVIKNGLYNKDTKRYTCEFEWDTDLNNFGDFVISLDNFNIHCTGYDDLGYPTSICVTADRDVSININGTNVIVVQNQKIVSRTINLNGNGQGVYYEGSKSGRVQSETLDSTHWSSGILKAMSAGDKSSNDPEIVSIAGNYYGFVTDKNSFNAAKNAREVSVIILKADINFGDSSNLTISKNITGNNHFVNYFEKNSQFLKKLDSNCFIKDLDIGACLISSGSTIYSLGIDQVGSGSIVKNLNTYGSMSIIGTPRAVSYFIARTNNGTISNCSNYANYSAFNDQYDGRNSIGVRFNGVSENYGTVIGFDGEDGETARFSIDATLTGEYYYNVESFTTYEGRLQAFGSRIEDIGGNYYAFNWSVHADMNRDISKVVVAGDDLTTLASWGASTELIGYVYLTGSENYYSYYFSTDSYGGDNGRAIFELSKVNADDNILDAQQGESFDLSNVTNYGLIKAGNGGNGGRGGDGKIGEDSSSSSEPPTQGKPGGTGGSAGSAGTVEVASGSTGYSLSGAAGSTGYAGNTGHGGLWLAQIDTTIYSVYRYWENPPRLTNSLDGYDGETLGRVATWSYELYENKYMTTEVVYDGNGDYPYYNRSVWNKLWIDNTFLRGRFYDHYDGTAGGGLGDSGWQYLSYKGNIFYMLGISHDFSISDGCRFYLDVSVYNLVPKDTAIGAGVPTEENKDVQDYSLTTRTFTSSP